MKECNQYDNWCEKEKRSCKNCYYERGYNMTDEEMKAVDYWKNYMEILHWNTQLASEHYMKVLLNLIENQSKEIEELKTENAKRNWVHIKENGEVEPLFYVSEYKIKAKIEELKEDINPLSIDNSKFAIKVLQSILKEEE